VKGWLWVRRIRTRSVQSAGPFSQNAGHELYLRGHLDLSDPIHVHRNVTPQSRPESKERHKTLLLKQRSYSLR
jgi:hypothetical protein